MNGHENCNHAYRDVKCDRCGDEFRCTPSRDFYCTPEGDHCCEPCLVGNRRLAVVDPEMN